MRAGTNVSASPGKVVALHEAVDVLLDGAIRELEKGLAPTDRIFGSVPASSRIRAAAKRTSEPRAMKCVASPRGISWRMSSTTLWMWRRSRRVRRSWLPCHAATLWRMRIDPSA